MGLNACFVYNRKGSFEWITNNKVLSEKVGLDATCMTIQLYF